LSNLLTPIIFSHYRINSVSRVKGLQFWRKLAMTN